MAGYDAHNPLFLTEEEEDLFWKFFQLAAAKRWSSPWSWNDWAEFWRLGRVLWRTRKERPDSFRPTLGGGRWSGSAVEAEWIDQFNKWLILGYRLARDHDEARDSNLLCHAALRAIEENLGDSAGIDLETLMLLRPTAPNLAHKINQLAAKLRFTAD